MQIFIQTFNNAIITVLRVDIRDEFQQSIPMIVHMHSPVSIIPHNVQGIGYNVPKNKTYHLV